MKTACQRLPVYFACAYATIYYAYHEETTLFQDNLKPFFYCRKIDNALIIDTNFSNEKHAAFLKAMNNYTDGNNTPLEWLSTTPSKTVDFLDLTITTDKNNKIVTKTFQKSMNLNLYIPSQSAHPQAY
jgi:hypothetical protein